MIYFIISYGQKITYGGKMIVIVQLLFHSL